VYTVAGIGILISIVLTLAGFGEEAGHLHDWQALILGAVQGLTELLPISSSGHLILVPWLGDWHFLEEHAAFNKVFDVALHLGTLVAVVAYFWGDIVGYIAAWFESVRRRSIETPDERIAWAVVVATVPTAVAGAAGEEFFTQKLGQPWQIAFFLAGFGALLYLADRRPAAYDVGRLRFSTAFLIGISQIIALAPGVSRSGITITTGRFAGLDRDSAARFSFLLLVPIVAGAVVFEGLKYFVLGSPPSGWVGPFVVGMIASAAVGLVAIDVLLGYVRTHDYTPFVVYRIVAALLVLLIIAGGGRGPAF
jgi:undecaprenyl-diphosphatase